MRNKKVLIPVVVLGFLFVGCAFLYWFTPANALPSFLPGFDPTLSKIHLKHGIGCVLIGLALLAFAWFESGAKSASTLQK